MEDLLFASVTYTLVRTHTATQANRSVLLFMDLSPFLEQGSGP